MNNLKKLLFRAVLAVSVVAPMLSSCSEFDEIWNKIDSIESQLDSIQNDLNAQVEALSALMTDGSTISSCTKKDDGSYVVKLSNGTEFTVLPAGTDFSALVSTYTDQDGSKYWATYDPDGNLVPLKDASGKLIPIASSVEVELIDGVYYLVVNGEKYQTGYDAEDVVSVFSSCEPLKDASGNVYAMTFTFGNGQKVTVTVDGYKGVIFKLSSLAASSAVSEYYVGYGEKVRFIMEVDGVIDYVMQIPDGWRVDEVYEELTGTTYVDITAPAESVVAAGAAVAKGDLKVVSVVEGGKAAVTKLSLSTDPFKVYNVSATKAVITPMNGIQKFAYGMMNLQDFDEDQLVAKVNELLAATGDLPKGYYIGETSIDKTLAEIYGSELATEGEYLFWVVPALYNEDKNGAGGYYAVKTMLRTKVLAPVSVKEFTVSNVSVLGADLKVDVRGTLSMYAGIELKSENILEEIVYQINNDAVTPINTLTYSGPAGDFPTKEAGLEIEPNTEYVVWIVPVEAEKEAYLPSDVIYKEFKTLDVQPGGTQTLTIGDVTVDHSSISMPVSSSGASMIYYAWMNDTEGKRLSQADDKDKISKMQASESFTVLKSASGIATIDFIKPETTMWLFAVAVGTDGKYGEVVSKSAKTEAITFNSLSVSVADPVVTVGNAVFNITVSGGTATDYIYWCGKETDPFWLYEEYCDGSRLGAQEYMAANPDAKDIQDVMRKNGKVSADGTLTITDLALNTTYVFMVLAQDETGKYSKGTMKKFNTPAADLGNMVVTGSERWNTAKTFIEDNIEWLKEEFESNSGMMQASYAFNIKVPTDLTAYIYGYTPMATNVIDIILEIEEYCISKTSTARVVYDENGDYPTHPDWYDDNGKLIQGSLVNVYDFYAHGSPKRASVTYFSANGHSAMHCNAWLGDKCSNYEEQMQSIETYQSFEYWKEYIIDFGNYHYNNDPTHEYSRTLTDPEKIDNIAKQYQELYTKYYKDTKSMIYINNGDALNVINREAAGLDEYGNVMDQVVIVLKDEQNNYFEPIYIPVPNYFK